MEELHQKINELEKALLEAEENIAKLKVSALALRREISDLRDDQARAAMDSTAVDSSTDEEGEATAPAEILTPVAEDDSPALAEDAKTESQEENAAPAEEAPSAAPEAESEAPAESVPEEPSLSEAEHEAIMRTIESLSQPLGNASRPTVEDRFQDRPTLSDRVGAKKLNDLKRGIGINERFLYANELFGGDMGAFSQALDELNHVASEHDANRLLEENLGPKYRWNEEDETVAAFKSLVQRKFAQ